MKGRIGSIRHRGGDTYQLVVSARRDPVTGEHRQLTRTVHAKSERDAARQLAAFVAEAGAGRLDRATGARTVGQLCAEWLEHAQSTGQVDPSTAEVFDGTIRRNIEPTLGAMPLDKVRAVDLDQLYRKLLRSGGRKGRPLAPATVRKSHTILRLAFAQGVRWEWLAENPALHATPPAVPKPDITPPETDQVRQLISTADALDPDWGTFLRVSSALGRRRGELCALRWRSVDLDHGTVTIRRVVKVVVGGPVVVEYPKTPSGTRTIALDPVTAGVLRAHRKRQAERALAAGTRPVDDAYLFSPELDGSRPWDPQVVTHRFERLRKRAGTPGVRLHDLRHYVATQLLGAGVDPVAVAGRLGWSRASMALDVYAAWIPARDQAVADVMGQLLDGRGDR